MQSERCFILGAPDPEMEAIQAILMLHGELYVFAVDPVTKRRVSAHPGA
jgi:hypothetical protein